MLPKSKKTITVKGEIFYYMYGKSGLIVIRKSNNEKKISVYKNRKLTKEGSWDAFPSSTVNFILREYFNIKTKKTFRTQKRYFRIQHHRGGNTRWKIPIRFTYYPLSKRRPKFGWPKLRKRIIINKKLFFYYVYGKPPYKNLKVIRQDNEKVKFRINWKLPRNEMNTVIITKQFIEQFIKENYFSKK